MAMQMTSEVIERFKPTMIAAIGNHPRRRENIVPHRAIRGPVRRVIGSGAARASRSTGAGFPPA
jgi:hypothetical protein